jgi:hypothetical protein
MGKARDYLREVIPILARTHPVFRRPARAVPSGDAGSLPGDASDVGDDLRSEIRGLRREVRQLSEEVGRLRTAKVGRDGPRSPRQGN